jgi:hypothetical protein
MKGKHTWLRAIRHLLPASLASTLVSLSLTPIAAAVPAELVSRDRDADSRIWVYLGPGTDWDERHYGLRGDSVEVLMTWPGSDGDTWYYVQFEESRALGWVHEDHLRISEVARDPEPLEQPVQLIVDPSPSTARIEPPRQTYSDEQIDYFLEIALGSEFGSGSAVIKKWEQDVRIRVHGNPTAEDRNTLEDVVAELNDLVSPSGIRLVITDRNPNVDIHFAPESQFSRIEPNYRPRNMGFFWTWWRSYALNRARILISTTGIDQTERSHLIREELTQALGLMQDSRLYSDSIFFQGWTRTTSYSDIDRAVIAMLYRPEIQPGMTRSQVIASLRNNPTVLGALPDPQDSPEFNWQPATPGWQADYQVQEISVVPTLAGIQNSER